MHRCEDILSCISVLDEVIAEFDDTSGPPTSETVTSATIPRGKDIDELSDSKQSSSIRNPTRIPLRQAPKSPSVDKSTSGTQVIFVTGPMKKLNPSSSNGVQKEVDESNIGTKSQSTPMASTKSHEKGESKMGSTYSKASANSLLAQLNGSAASTKIAHKAVGNTVPHVEDKATNVNMLVETKSSPSMRVRTTVNAINHNTNISHANYRGGSCMAHYSPAFKRAMGWDVQTDPEDKGGSFPKVKSRGPVVLDTSSVKLKGLDSMNRKPHVQELTTGCGKLFANSSPMDKPNESSVAVCCGNDTSGIHHSPKLMRAMKEEEWNFITENKLPRSLRKTRKTCFMEEGNGSKEDSSNQSTMSSNPDHLRWQSDGGRNSRNSSNAEMDNMDSSHHKNGKPQVIRSAAASEGGDNASPKLIAKGTNHDANKDCTVSQMSESPSVIRRNSGTHQLIYINNNNNNNNVQKKGSRRLKPKDEESIVTKGKQASAPELIPIIPPYKKKSESLANKNNVKGMLECLDAEEESLLSPSAFTTSTSTCSSSDSSNSLSRELSKNHNRNEERGSTGAKGTPLILGGSSPWGKLSCNGNPMEQQISKIAMDNDNEATECMEKPKNKISPVRASPAKWNVQQNPNKVIMRREDVRVNNKRKGHHGSGNNVNVHDVDDGYLSMINRNEATVLPWPEELVENETFSKEELKRLSTQDPVDVLMANVVPGDSEVTKGVWPKMKPLLIGGDRNLSNERINRHPRDNGNGVGAQQQMVKYSQELQKEYFSDDSLELEEPGEPLTFLLNEPSQYLEKSVLNSYARQPVVACPMEVQDLERKGSPPAKFMIGPERKVKGEKKTANRNQVDLCLPAPKPCSFFVPWAEGGGSMPVTENNKSEVMMNSGATTGSSSPGNAGSPAHAFRRQLTVTMGEDGTTTNNLTSSSMHMSCSSDSGATSENSSGITELTMHNSNEEDSVLSISEINQTAINNNVESIQTSGDSTTKVDNNNGGSQVVVNSGLITPKALNSRVNAFLSVCRADVSGDTPDDLTTKILTTLTPYCTTRNQIRIQSNFKPLSTRNANAITLVSVPCQTTESLIGPVGETAIMGTNSYNGGKVKNVKKNSKGEKRKTNKGKKSTTKNCVDGLNTKMNEDKTEDVGDLNVEVKEGKCEVALNEADSKCENDDENEDRRKTEKISQELDEVVNMFFSANEKFLSELEKDESLLSNEEKVDQKEPKVDDGKSSDQEDDAIISSIPSLEDEQDFNNVDLCTPHRDSVEDSVKSEGFDSESMKQQVNFIINSVLV